MININYDRDIVVIGTKQRSVLFQNYDFNVWLNQRPYLCSSIKGSDVCWDVVVISFCNQVVSRLFQL